MLAARTGAVEHFGGSEIVGRPANRAVGINVQISERGIFLPGLMVGQRVIHYRVLGDFGNGDVARDVVQIGAVVLAHQEKLAAVAKYGGADARLLETRIARKKVV